MTSCLALAHTPLCLYHISTVDILVCCLHLCKVIFSCHLCCDFFLSCDFKHRSVGPQPQTQPAFPVCFMPVINSFLLVFTSALLSSQSTLTSEAASPETLPSFQAFSVFLAHKCRNDSSLHHPAASLPKAALPSLQRHVSSLEYPHPSTHSGMFSARQT